MPEHTGGMKDCHPDILRVSVPAVTDCCLHEC